jgi:hypothetical protein
VSEGGLERTNPRFFPGSALEYAGGGEIPCSGISCAHASGRARARVKRARRPRLQGRGRRRHPRRDCHALAQSAGRSRSVTAAGMPSSGRLVALISAPGRRRRRRLTSRTVAAVPGSVRYPPYAEHLTTPQPHKPAKQCSDSPMAPASHRASFLRSLDRRFPHGWVHDLGVRAQLEA